MRKIAVLIVLLLCVPIVVAGNEETFWEAARQGDLETMKRLHAEGVDVNARSRYGATALSFACDKGHLEVARWLIEQGADLNNKDDFYEGTPIGWATYNEHTDVVVLLLENGAEGAKDVLTAGVQQNNEALVAAALKTEEIDGDDLATALAQARQIEDGAKIVALLEGSDIKPVERPVVTVDPKTLEGYEGNYRNAEIELDIEIRVEEGKLVAQATAQPPLALRPLSESRFEAIDYPQIKLEFSGRGGIVEQMVLEQGGRTFPFLPATESAESATVAEPPAEAESPDAAAATTTAKAAPTEIKRLAAQNWPQFRGPQASGIADGQGAVVEWNVESGDNIRWKTPIPGMANSSPIVWGDRVFVTTAISSAGDDTFRTGLYGDVDSVEDLSEHLFKVYALSKKTGKIEWEREVAKAVPGAKRHMKSTQANSTPVTDGKRVVALFGTIGVLVAFDMDGKPLWKTDVGVLDSGWFYDPTYQWGHASSPVIHDDVVIVQADIYSGSFIAAYRLSDGKQAWKTTRDDVPSWGSPTSYRGKDRDELIVNGATIRGYDPKTGKELWMLTPNSEVTVATPVIAHDLFYVTAGYPPARPVYAIRPGGNGDLSLAEGETASERIAWSKDRGGTYMPTPIVYGDHLYTCANDGRLTCYEAKTGERVYRARVGGGGSFTASPIAADGRLYFSNEDGDVVVVKAGAEYEELGKNEMAEVVMATPAISDGVMVVRTLGHVYGVGEPQPEP